MSKTNQFETSFLNHVFTNADIVNVGDASGLIQSTASGSLFISLLTGDPGESGVSSSEAAYTSYARVAVDRTGSEWTVSGNQASNANTITFPTATGGDENLTHFAVHTSGSTGDMLFYGTLTSPLSASNGITPEFAGGQLTATED